MDIEVIVNGHRYRHLLPRPDSHHKGLFYRERKIRADTLYRLTVGEDAQTPEQVAADYGIPVEAVLEAIHFCTHNEEFLRQEYVREEESAKTNGLDGARSVPVDGAPK
jgi:uncharacterized protein (DUF433 family)